MVLQPVDHAFKIALGKTLAQVPEFGSSDLSPEDQEDDSSLSPAQSTELKMAQELREQLEGGHATIFKHPQTHTPVNIPKGGAVLRHKRFKTSFMTVDANGAPVQKLDSAGQISKAPKNILMSNYVSMDDKKTVAQDEVGNAVNKFAEALKKAADSVPVHPVSKAPIKIPEGGKLYQHWRAKTTFIVTDATGKPIQRVGRSGVITIAPKNIRLVNYSEVTGPIKVHDTFNPVPQRRPKVKPPKLPPSKAFRVTLDSNAPPLVIGSLYRVVSTKSPNNRYVFYNMELVTDVGIPTAGNEPVDTEHGLDLGTLDTGSIVVPEPAEFLDDPAQHDGRTEAQLRLLSLVGAV